MVSQQEQLAAIQAQQEMEQMKAQVAALQAAQVQSAPAPAPMPAAAAATQPDLLTQLNQLAQLRDAGALTEAEFEAAKAKILG
jgi:hemolysin activation/secretion protein